jgi:hypothetical protein
MNNGPEFKKGKREWFDIATGWANIIIAIIAIATFWITWKSIIDSYRDSQGALRVLEEQASSSAAQAVALQEQATAFKREIDLTSAEMRPYVDTVVTQNDISATTTHFLDLENNGQIPADIIYFDQIAKTFDQNNNSITSLGESHLDDSRVLYPGRRLFTIGFVQPILNETIVQGVIANHLEIQIATCFIYKSLDQNDVRRWQINEVWLLNNSNYSLILSSDMLTMTNKCNAEPLFSQVKY